MTRLLAVMGVVAIPILPVLIARAPLIFRVPAIIYLVWSLVILVRTARSE